MKAFLTLPTCLSALVIAGCVSNGDTISPIEKVLGPGWTCHAAPDQYKAAGVVLQKNTDGVMQFDSEFRDQSIVGAVAIGNKKYSANTTAGGVLKLLKAVDVLADADASANITGNTTINVSYGGTNKHLLPGANARQIARDLDAEGLLDELEFYLIRESISAKEINIIMKGDLVVDLAGKINIDNIVNANPKFSRDRNDDYVLNESFDSGLGVCTLVSRIVVEGGIDGSKSTSLGSDVKLPPDFDITNVP